MSGRYASYWNAFLFMIVLVFQNQTQVATSLQVFHNLGSLEQTVDKVIVGCYESMKLSVRSALDVTVLSKSKGHTRTGIILFAVT